MKVSKKEKLILLAVLILAILGDNFDKIFGY
jgi:hypothetical protein